jgi:RHS repeat-associated protein
MRFAEISDPLGYNERLEFLQGAPGIPSEDSPVPVGITPFNYQGSMIMQGRDTYYWDKHVLPLYRGDYTKARARHWLHDTTQPDVTSNVIESVKNPLERRVWRNYPGQYCGGCLGGLNKPSIVARVLDDGSTQSMQYTYNWRGNLTSVTDPAGRLTVYDYASPAIEFLYDPGFFTALPVPRTSAIDSKEGVDLLDIEQQTSIGTFATIATFTYNNQHLPLTYTDEAGQTTQYAYNSAGQLTQATNPLNETTTYIYDNLGDLIRVVNANSQTQASFTYDDYSRVATATDSEGYSVAFAYDALDRLVKETFPDGTSRQYTWDKLDLASVMDRQGRTTVYTHDADRRLVAVTDPLGQNTIFSYYENGQLKSLTDPKGNTTTWNIDIEKRVTSKQYADGRQWLNRYENTTSRMKSITDPLGQTKQYTYTVDDLLAGINYVNAVNPTPGVSFSYDPYFRRKSSMSDGSGTTQYQYGLVNALGALKLSREVEPYQNTAIGYQYDALGRMSRRMVDSSSEGFAYDNIGRLTTHSSPLGTFTLSYLGQTNQVISRSLGVGPVNTRWQYDTNINDRRLMKINNGAQPRNYSITTTPEGLVAELDVMGGGGPQSWSYSYDADSRLLSASSSSAGQYSYNYDSADNIITLRNPTNGENVNYNNLNQVVNFGNSSFTYDADGNLLSDGMRTYQWDAENRLLSVGSNNQVGKQTSFSYNGIGRRIGIVSSNQGTDQKETRYLWCGDSLCQARNSTDAVIHRYYAEGELLSGNALYYAQDQLGSVRDVLGLQTGRTVASFDYDPYGSITSTRGSVLPDFRYAHLFYEQNSGLYLAEHRAYDPRTGQWLSRDPIGEAGSAINLYGYVKEDPVYAIDPSGLDLYYCGGSVGYGIPGSPYGGQFSVGFGFDTSTGNVFGYSSAGWGISTPGGSGSLYLGYFNGTLGQFSGPGYQVSGGAEGVYGGLTTAGGTGGGELGVGTPGAFGGATYTNVGIANPVPFGSAGHGSRPAGELF